MSKIIKTIFFSCLLAVQVMSTGACSKSSFDYKTSSITIVSYQLRNRIITFQQPSLYSSLIVGFKLDERDIPHDRVTVTGELSRNGSLIGRDSIPALDAPTGSLCFAIPQKADMSDRDRPYDIPDGLYEVHIRVVDRSGRVLAECREDFRRNQLGRTFVAKGYEYPPLRVLPYRAPGGTPVVASVYARVDGDGGTFFAHSPQERVFVDSVPARCPAGKGVTVSAARGEIRPLALSARSKKDLGVVSLEVSPLRGSRGLFPGAGITWGVVRDLTEVARDDAKNATVFVRRAPRLIESGTVRAGKDETRSFWLTLAVPASALPGTYRGSIALRSQGGERLTLPLTVEVLPFTLPEPDIRFGMMMDYAFHELDNPAWSRGEKSTLRKRGAEIYRDLRAHGMTVAYPHSYFFYRADDQGRPVLEGVKAALASYREEGFPGPFVWYLGHLLNTAKPQHPGSILLYDEAVAVRRLRVLLGELERLCRSEGVAKEKVLIQVVDEPESRDRVRTEAGEKLYKIVREMGFRTLVTRPWPGMDVICTGEPDDDAEAARLRRTAREWWIYPNGALTGQNLSYTRYVFGFGAWRWGVSGVVPWTYQMSLGCNGNPFTALDGPEIMVAYPGADGPIPTPMWETIREGINDYRYTQRLRALIAAAKSRGDQRGIRVERELERLRASLGKGPSDAEGAYGAFSPGSFDAVRSKVIALMEELR